ncbi:MAG: protein translocase SEC61 complex subunit gamma [Thermoplasmata archaeon]|nr:protein translocase SEC61 complex subunit gamma [Euryarchaeota archaeon]RLF63203.1 MAG: protein translocase SEC61 complex subunit gamma [Thermoplasmata archaeon]
MILNFAQKPDEEEYYQLAKVSLGVLLFVGFLGFLVYLAFHYLLGK